MVFAGDGGWDMDGLDVRGDDGVGRFKGRLLVGGSLRFRRGISGRRVTATGAVGRDSRVEAEVAFVLIEAGKSLFGGGR